MRKVLFICCLLPGVILFSPFLNTVSAQTNVSGPITQNATWNLAGSPYIVTGDVTVNSTVTLTIDAGVEVKFNGNYSLIVNGTLNSLGTAAQRVKFTSNQTTPARGDWNRIQINNGSSTLNYLEVEYSNEGIYLAQNVTGVTIQNGIFTNNNNGVHIETSAGATVQNSSFQNNREGLWAGSATAVVTGSTLTNNVDGILMGCSSAFGCNYRVNNNSIHGNTGYNFRAVGNPSTVTMDAENNWWGTVDPIAIMASILDYQDNNQLPAVDFIPFLDAPNGNPIGQNYLYGNLTGTLTQNLSPYIAITNLTVPVNTALTIQAGVEIKFAGNFSLTVNGTLVSQGTATQRVKFTSNQAAPVRGDWNAIWILNAAGPNTLNFIEVEYANNGIQVGDYVHGPFVPVDVQNSVFTNNNYGVYDNGATAIMVQNSSFQNNGNGIYAGASLSVTNSAITNNTNGIYYLGQNCTVNNNSIHSNSGYNFTTFFNSSANLSHVTLNAENNWWGTTDPAAIMASIYDFQDLPRHPTVDFTPFLDAPNGNPIGQNYLYGNLAGTLTQSLSPYVVLGNAVIRPNTTLTIQAGVQVKFNGNYYLRVEGTLVSQGTATQRVKFTSNRATPARGDWDKIWVANAAGPNTLSYIEVEYADRGVQAGDRVTGPYVPLDVPNSVFTNNNMGVYVDAGTTITIQNSSFQNNATGIWNNNGAMTASNNTITNNTDGVHCIGGIDVSHINNNSIYGNAGFNLSMGGPPQLTLDAENNWWGSVDPAVIMAKIWDYQDDLNLATVDFIPFLDAPNGNPIGQNYLYGNLAGTLTQSLSPYVVLGNAVIRPNTTLTIQAGVQVKFNGNYYLRVEGTLVSQGTATQRVKFTSNRATPARGDWDKIWVANAAGPNTLSYIEVEYADRGVQAGDRVTGPYVPLDVPNSVFTNNNMGVYVDAGTTITIQNSSFQNNATGIWNNNGAMTASNNTITNNTDGVHCIGGIDVSHINNNSIYGNAGFNLSMGGPPQLTLDAENNWWGSVDPAVIMAKIWDYQDDLNLATVDFIPFLDAPNGNPIGQNYLYGNLAGTLTQNVSPYIVIGNAVIQVNTALTIQAGVEVKFAGNYSLTVNGTLNSLGTATQRVKFTSNRATPARGDWNKIQINTNNNTLSYLQVEYADKGINGGINQIGVWIQMIIQNSVFLNNNAGVWVDRGSVVTIQNSDFQNNGVGVYLDHNLATLTNNTIINNANGIAIHCLFGSPCDNRITSNSIYNNTHYNVNTSHGGGESISWITIDAENNWWGTTDPAAIALTINDYTDNSRFPVVDFDPYLASANGPPLITNISRNPVFFNPLSSETTAINYTLPVDSTITIKIYDSPANTLVRTLLNSAARLAGPHSEIWDGKNNTNQILPLGSYFFTIDVVTVNNIQGAYSPPPRPGQVTMNNGLISPLNFDPYKGEVATITYDLPSPAIVTLKVGRMGVFSQPSRTIFTSQSRNAIGQSEVWDGRDDAGNIVNCIECLAVGWTSGIVENVMVLSIPNFRIEYVISNPYAFYPDHGEVTEIKYRISQNASVTALIKDPANNTVRTLVNNQQQSAGEYTVIWNGKDNTGAVVSVPGHYRIQVTATYPGNLFSDTRVGNITVFK